MKVIELPAFGLEKLRVAQREIPKPAADEVLVKFGAASINSRDYQICTGAFSPDAPLPIIPCSDGAGELVEAGAQVTELSVGDKVAPLFFPEWQSGEAFGDVRSISSGLEAPGTLREYGVYKPHQVVKLAPHLSAEQGACFPCAGLTAWTCVSTLAGVGAGDDEWVLVQGTGGVAIFALQFARALGARVIATSGSDEKLKRAKSLGAEFGINYHQTPDWGEKARELTGGRGVDCVVEIGGEGTLPQSVKALRRGGHVGIVGYFTGIGLGLTVFDLIERNAQLHGVSVGNREGFEAMMSCVHEHALEPVVDRVYPFDEAPAAIAAIAEGGHFGKLVVHI